MIKTQHKRTAVASMFQNGISQNTKCAEKDGFHRAGHILLLIAHSCLSITQASSSFKRLGMRKFTYATPTFITEAFCLVMLVQLLLMTVTVN